MNIYFLFYYSIYTGIELSCFPFSRFLFDERNKKNFSYLLTLRFKLKPAKKIPNRAIQHIIKDENIYNNESVLNWIKEQISPRVILVGEPGSGKSTLVSLVHDSSKFPEENIATDGIAISKSQNISFWDFGGQEVLCNTHQFFLVDQCQYIITCDLSKLIHEDKKIRNKCIMNINFWMKEIKNYVINKDSPPIMLVGTHCDIIYSYISSSLLKKAKSKFLKLAKSNQINYYPQIFELYKSSRKRVLTPLISDIVTVINDHFTTYNNLESSILQESNYSLQYALLKYNINELKKNKKKIFMRWKEFEKIIFDSFYSQDLIIRFTRLFKISGIIETYRFESTAASDIVILDPKKLSKLFTSIVSITKPSSDNKRGFYQINSIEESFKSLDTPDIMFNEIISIFEQFHLLVKLPSGVYYVPSMLASPKVQKPECIGNQKIELIKNQFKEKNIQHKFTGRRYIFKNSIPFGMINKLIIKFLHFPGIKLHSSTWTDDFYLYSEEDGNYNHRFYHILVRLTKNKNLKILIYYPRKEEECFYFSFFCHFIFQSPLDILHSYPNIKTKIKDIIILNNNCKFEESKLLFNFRNHLSVRRAICCNNKIKIYNSDEYNCTFTKKLGGGLHRQIWAGFMNKNNQVNNKLKIQVVFKESRVININNLRNFMNEIIMTKTIENCFTIKLIGICIPSLSLFESRKQILMYDNDNNNNSIQMVENEDNQFYTNHQVLMIIEEAPWGNLTHCHDIIQEKNSTKLKLKIAFDIARGLNSLFFTTGVHLIHRDVRSENIFIFSLDENNVSDIESVHAKLGDFSNIVIASPSYSQRISNYQYTAPEALRGSLFVPYSRKIDVYSFGILFWEILTGKIPFHELSDHSRTCNRIEEEIINGYRPSIDDLPHDVPEHITQIIQECWDPNPNFRPNFGKIISILTIILHLGISNDREIRHYLPIIESTYEIKQKIIGKYIDTSFFTNIEFKGQGCNGLVMICDFLLERKVYKVALKMLIQLYSDDISSSDHRKSINEYNILPQIQQHPNIICLLGSFQSIPSDLMLKNISHSIIDLCYNNDGTPKKSQFYILEAYEKTLDAIINDLDEYQILNYSIQLSSALLFLFNHNIVHLDIKLDNLMISINGDLIVVDFGVAGKMNSNGFVNYNQTIGGNILGLSPEVLLARSDKKNLPCKLQHSWELGIVIFLMFNQGKYPFKDYSSSFSEFTNIDMSKIPPNFKSLISSLLCPSNERISIHEAHEILLNISSFT